MLHQIADACGDLLRIGFDFAIIAFAIWLWRLARDPGAT